MTKLSLSAAAAILIAGLVAGFSPAISAVSAPRFQVDRMRLPGEGRGDYITVDPDGRRLYVTHSAAVHILDLDTLRPIATVGGLKAAHGVALDPATGHGFVTDGGQNAVAMFDLRTGETLKTIPAGEKPDSILRDGATGKIFVFNGDSDDVSVIDPATATVIGTIKLPHGPEFSQADGNGKIWVNMEDGNDIGEIDARTMALVRTINLPGCDGPAPLSFDRADRLLFSGCGNKVMTVTDADTGQVLTTVPVGEDPDGIAYDPARKRIYVANRDGGWTVVDQVGRDSYKVNQTLKIDEYAKTIALDPKSHRLFSSTADLVWPAAVPGQKHLPNAKTGTFRLMIVSEQ